MSLSVIAFLVLVAAFAIGSLTSISAGLLALVAAGSGGSGLVYGARTWRAPVGPRFLLALAGLAVGVAPLLLAPTVGVLAPLALLSGIAISPIPAIATTTATTRPATVTG